MQCVFLAIFVSRLNWTEEARRASKININVTARRERAFLKIIISLFCMKKAKTNKNFHIL